MLKYFLLQKYLSDCGARVRAAGSRVPAGAGRVRARGSGAAAVAGGGGGRLPRQRDGGHPGLHPALHPGHRAPLSDTVMIGLFIFNVKTQIAQNVDHSLHV